MRPLTIIIVLAIFITYLGCKKEIMEPSEYEIDRTLPDDRSFYLGFTAFPYDVTPEAAEQSYRNQAENSDILLTHFDHGVPWNEALNDEPFPAEVQTAIDEAIENDTPDHKVFLTATATDTDRDKLAKYWNNNGPHQSLPADWAGKSFNSPEVIKAYRNYCYRIIDAIQPDYFAYGIEINGSFKEGTKPFRDYMEFADSIYHDLKSSYPTIPIMLTFQDQSFNKDKEELHQLTSRLLQYSDMIAVSTYPFWLYDHPERDANPALFPNDWLAELRNLAPDKPFTVSETGYCAEDLKLKDFGVDIKGTAEWQRDYVQKLMAESNRIEAEFVIWFIYRDYDLLESHLPEPSVALKIWRDTGLEDGRGNKRPSHDVWGMWKSLEVD